MERIVMGHYCAARGLIKTLLKYPLIESSLFGKSLLLLLTRSDPQHIFDRFYSPWRQRVSGWFGSQAGQIEKSLSQYFSSFAEFLFEYDPISTETWNRNCCIWWYITEQQTSATIHMWISSWYWRRFGVNDFKHVNSIWGQCYQFWNFTISSNCQRRQNWSRWFHWSVDWT